MGNYNCRWMEVLIVVNQVDYSKAIGPTIDTSKFTNTISSYYWSSTTFANITSIIWSIDFNYGIMSTYGKTGTISVRCVR